MYDLLPPQHSSTSIASLLIAALALLNRRCPRNEINAARLLQRVALSPVLTPAEREVCRTLAEELEH